MTQERQGGGILGDEDLAILDAALSAGEDARAQIAQARQAGIDVTGMEKALDEQLARARSIKQAFFPGR